MAGVKAWPVVGNSATGGVEGGVDLVISPRALQAGLRSEQLHIVMAYFEVHGSFDFLCSGLFFPARLATEVFLSDDGCRADS